MTGPSEILSIDFDGVLHSYKSGWKGIDQIPDDPVPGAMAFLEEAVKHFVVNIFSSRSQEPEGIQAMKDWIRRHYQQRLDVDDIEVDRFMRKLRWPTKKPAAHLFLDDRAMCFTGTFPSMRTIADFVPWHKQE